MLLFSQYFCILSMRVPKAARRTPCDWARFLLLVQFSSTMWSIQIVDILRDWCHFLAAALPRYFYHSTAFLNDCQFFLECVSKIFHRLFHPIRSASVSALLTQDYKLMPGVMKLISTTASQCCAPSSAHTHTHLPTSPLKRPHYLKIYERP